MLSTFEQIIVFAVMSILVVLFASIYRREPQKKYRLWMFGWTAILVHFAVPLAAHWRAFSPKLSVWCSLATLLIAGSYFLLSVSEVYIGRRRLLFGATISFSALIYLSAMLFHPLPKRAYAAILLVMGATTLYQVFRHHGLRKPYGYVFALLFVPPLIWAALRALNGAPAWGFYLFLATVFIATGVQYWRHFRRHSSGVLLTSIAFLCWGLVFPIATLLMSLHVVIPFSAVVWDLPKYFVAFGMILTLFENEAEIAGSMARQYQDLFEANLASVYLSTLEGTLLNCNTAFVQMYGFHSKEEALACPAADSYADPAARAGFVAALKSEGKVVNYECRQRRHDGTLFWILERARLINHPSGRQVIEGTAVDITERKQAELRLKESEERFATIFQESPVGCALISLEGAFLNVNDHLARMLGLPANKVVGQTALELGLWSSQQQRDEFYQRLRAEGSVQNLEVTFKDSAGNEHEGLYFASLVRIGDRDCILGMLLDQTEKRELEAKFLQAQKMDSLGRLAGGVAHDFNNLLGVIGGYAELLEAKLGANDGYSKYCRKIIETTQRGSGLTRQLLTFSRKEFTRPTPLRPDHVIGEVSGILPRLIGENIELLVDLRSSGTVLMDKTHLEQIIFNLVINARDAMPNGGRIRIETEDVFRPSVSEAGSVAVKPCVALRISDNGTGMEQETLAHVFEPFYTTKETGRGTGLGLSTVYGIVQQANGEIGVESEPGCGTQVNILFPAVPEPESPAADNGLLELKKGLGRILLVEDEIALRDANAEFLCSLGYQVLCASGGHEALDIAREDDHIDLVITDVVMPRMNGREFAEALAEFRPELKVLFISGYADDVVLQAGISIKGVPFLQKPYSLKQLGNKVHELLTQESPQLQK
jgi:two-component system cell cycle sensor histidine kinase/response regulator CckA